MRLLNTGGKAVLLFDEVDNHAGRFIKELIEDEEYRLAIKDKIVIDIGANIGLFSIYVYPFASVIYAIESLSHNYNNLIKTIDRNRLENIKPFHLAISNIEGETGLYLEGNDYASGNILGHGQLTETVSTTTLAKFMRNNNIEYVDVLKCDTEGAEENIFLAEDFVTVIDKINLVIVEHCTESIENVFSNYQVVRHKNLIIFKK